MSTKPAKGPSPIIKLAILGILALAFGYLRQGLGYVSTRINELPVEGRSAVAAPAGAAGAPNSADAESQARVRNLHPLLVESHAKVDALIHKASPSDKPVNFDTLFGREAPKPVEPVKPVDAKGAAGLVPPGVPAVPVAVPVDNFKQLSLRVRVQATSKTGAIVNGSYVDLGEEVKTLGYPAQDSGKTLYPTLLEVSEDSILLAEANHGTRKILARLSH